MDFVLDAGLNVTLAITSLTVGVLDGPAALSASAVASFNGACTLRSKHVHVPCAWVP